MQVSSELLANVYGVSGQRLRFLRAEGAPIENPHALYEWLKGHGSQLGPLLALLLDATTRSDLKRKIELYGDPKVELAKLISEGNFDLLAIGAYGHSKVRSFILGSTTSQLIQTVKVPVLLIR